MKNSYRIGFANKFYTLWEVCEEPQYVLDAYGKYHLSFIRTVYAYVKNVSISREKAESLYPNVPVDTSLKGTTTFSKDSQVDLPSNYFWFGKYRGMLIDDVIVEDLKYCLWVVENGNSNNAQYIKTHPVYVTHLQKLQEERDAMLNNAIDLHPNQEVEIEFTSNGFNHDRYSGDTGCTAIGFVNGHKCWVRFPWCKPVAGRFPYIMPIVNGKACRTKGKTFKMVIESASKQIEYKNEVRIYITVK